MTLPAGAAGAAGRRARARPADGAAATGGRRGDAAVAGARIRPAGNGRGISAVVLADATAPQA